MKIGYARVSTSDQNLESQIDALKKAGLQYFKMLMIRQRVKGHRLFQCLRGRLRHGILPINTKKIEQVISNQRVGLDQFIKTLNQKEKRGYTLSDELGLI